MELKGLAHAFFILQTLEEVVMMYRLRGVRGAITVEENTAQAILGATRELLEEMVGANEMEVEDIASIVFTATPDLDAEFPALATRELDWLDTPLLCGQEMAVPGSLERCIRVLMHWNTSKRAPEIRHIYLRGAVALRPDRAAEGRE